jgi:hypothetical protein
MELIAEVLRRLDRGQPFRVAVPMKNLTELLTELADLRGHLPEIAIWPTRVDAADVLIDFSGAAGAWVLRGGRENEAEDSMQAGRVDGQEIHRHS